MSLQVWILTFNRPDALNRLVYHFGTLGYKVNILSNHPKLELAESNRPYIDRIIVNTLNSEESNSWCARSWNTILMKAFDNDDPDASAVLIQDDTDISINFKLWLDENTPKYDLIWGPAGDQFFYITKKVVQKVGWWDERYIGCYAGDAEYLKRCYIYFRDNSLLDRISVEDTHNWGFQHNPCGTSNHIITTYGSKTIDPNYLNQHWHFEQISGCGNRNSETNPTIKAAQALFEKKWGVMLDNGRPLIESLVRKEPELDWYPWFSRKHGITINA